VLPSKSDDDILIPETVFLSRDALKWRWAWFSMKIFYRTKCGFLRRKMLH